MYKDQYLEKEDSTKEDKAYLRGQLKVFDDIVGLVAFMKSFVIPEKLKEQV